MIRFDPLMGAFNLFLVKQYQMYKRELITTRFICREKEKTHMRAESKRTKCISRRAVNYDMTKVVDAASPVAWNGGWKSVSFPILS